MTKKGYKTTSIDIKMELYLLLVSREINISHLFNKIAAGLFDLPENPNEKLIRESSQYIVLQLKEKYDREIKELMKEHATQIEIDAANQSREQELIKFGELIKKTSAYPVFEICLKKHDFDDDTLRIVTSEINKMNGQRYDDIELWNRAIVWYQKYGEVSG